MQTAGIHILHVHESEEKLNVAIIKELSSMWSLDPYKTGKV